MARSEDWGAFDAQTTGAAASSQQPSQTLPEMSAIEKEIELWTQVIPTEKNIYLDILGYWKKQTTALPLLSWLARRILSIPASSAPSERVFSEGGRVVTASRTVLNTENAESLIWMNQNFDNLAPSIKNWVLRRSEYRKMDKSKSKEQSSSNPETSQSQSQDPDEPSETDSEGPSDYESDNVIDIDDGDDDEADIDKM